MNSKKLQKLNVLAQDDESMSESSSDNDSGGPHPDAYTGNEAVEVDFEGRAPTDPDSHGISQLLQRLFLKAHVNTVELANMIIAQNFVGSVICQCVPDDADSDEDDDMCEDGTIFGITTAINITAKKDAACIQQFRSFVIQKAEKYAPDSVLKHFRAVLDNETRHVGYLINERFINIPAQISVPLLENLNKEIQTANQKGMPFNLVYFLMIIKLYRDESKKGKSQADTYTNAEEELLAEKAVNSFEYSVASECDSGMGGDWLEGDETLTPYRKVILFDAKDLSQLILDIQTYINGQ